eukprot:PhF_6_TR30198/c1_g2_i1/m.44387
MGCCISKRGSNNQTVQTQIQTLLTSQRDTAEHHQGTATTCETFSSCVAQPPPPPPQNPPLISFIPPGSVITDSRDSSSVAPSSIGDALSMDISLFVNYHTVRTIGRGSYGSVYLVVHNSTGKLCAMKVIPHKKKSTPSSSSSLVTTISLIDENVEAMYLQRCRNHPCIVHLEEVIQSATTTTSVSCIVMEYVDGDPWGSSSLTHRRGPVAQTSESLRVVRGILRDVLLGLHYLHTIVGIAHMD